MKKSRDFKIEQQIEQDLIESKQLFKIVFDNSPSAITVTDSKERIVAWNPMAEKMLGMSRADLFNQPVSILYPPKEWKRFRSLNIRHHGMLSNIDTKVICKDGSLLDVSASISVLKDKSGRVVGSIGILYDITREKLAEHQMRESENKLRIILDNSAAAITMTDEKERIVSWNKFAEQLFGMGVKDLLLRPVNTLYPPEEWKAIRSLNIRQSGFKHHLETRAMRKDGTIIDVDLSVNILKDEQGNIVGSVGMLQDITEQKRAKELIVQAKLAAEEANNAKSVFLAKMSHEVRTPMNAIIGMIDLTLDTSLNEEQIDNLKVAKDAADNLLSLINDILDLSRAQAGKVVVEEIEINVPDIVKNVCKGLMVLARNKGIDVVWSIDPATPRLLIGDPVRLRQVLVNLVNNAVKFTHKGKVTVNVKVKSQGEKDCELAFEVIDNGIGISPKNLPHIFDVFTDAHNTTARRYGGTGLGLAICKKIVEMMRGSIEVDSKEGEGSTFRFNIIFGYKADVFGHGAGEQKAGDQPAGSSLPPELHHLRILLAEDNMVNQRIAIKILEKLGWQVTAVANGQEALNILNDQTFDVILMDDSMPVLGGVETVAVIRREEKQTGLHVPVIAMTANAMAGDREKYLGAGMDGYVSKPIDRQLLYEEIVNLVTRRLKD
ncbi:MAG: PAS domain S-box protein [Candidatus Omnitrophica bacterium]|nr:PAS domain S-box protein [Candidatus Omnitrophota bacterium]MDE2009179.1 PAS domain S-box protein [Candidatus Omnitrophota bacterium]MDE2213700.1 PAS domain S-box protein [Candidatus Omnitrophota bacterium]MDE2230725.1 PAS domain S-box protein [Candidatus Omnitrophota bacterium]